MNRNKINELIIAAILGTVSYLLMYLAFPIIPSVPYMTLDFSDVVILIIFKYWRKKVGYMTLFIKELLHFIFSGPSFLQLLGCLADTLAIIIFAEILIMGMKRLNFSIALILATFGMTFVMAIINYSILLPLYITALATSFELSIAQMVFFGVIPFNLIKGITVGIVYKIFSDRLFKIIKKM